MRLFLYFIFFFSAIISSTPSYSIDELSNYREKCEALGFTEGTENFGNCVMKLLENFPKLKITVERLHTYKPNSLTRDDSGFCWEPQILNGEKVPYWYKFENGNCPKSLKFFNGYAEDYKNGNLAARYLIQNSIAKKATFYWTEGKAKGLVFSITEYDERGLKS